MTYEFKHFIERHKGGERAILVQLYFYQKTPENALPEFMELCDSAGLNILNVVTGKRDKPSSSHFVGKGKAEEIKQVIDAEKADVVIINHELSAPQGRNLEKLFCVRVIDRTELILDIFAQRARTFEGKLQVELAQLQHLSTQLVRGWTHLERQKGGIGLRGPGETQLETDRRLLNMRIKSIKKRLQKVVTHREQGRRSRKRSETPTIALVGYTNAGKSTLFNRLTESFVYVADQLFATLDPTLRKLQLGHAGKVILADTVGFIRDLPHDLVAAFRATLEETRQADLLLHVVDSQESDYAVIMQEVANVLNEIGASDVPQLLVFNKIDLNPKYKARIDRGSDGLPKRVWISAASGEGIDDLIEAVGELLKGKSIRFEITLPHDGGKLKASLYAKQVVQSERHTEEGEVILECEMTREDYERLCNTCSYPIRSLE